MSGANQYSLALNWDIMGSHPTQYSMGIDESIIYQTGKSATIRCEVEHPEGFGTLMQTISAAKFRGKRVCFKGSVKTNEVEDCAGLWLRVDGLDGKAQAFDNMGDRPIKGDTDWQDCSVVLDVPVDARNICFGALLSGGGQIWFGGLEFNEISQTDKAEKLSDELPPLPMEPLNLDFSE